MHFVHLKAVDLVNQNVFIMLMLDAKAFER